MRQLFRSQYKFRDNLILLNYTKNLQKFSFLQTLVGRLDQTDIKKISNSAEKFRVKTNNYRSELLELQTHDFTEVDLNSIANDQSNKDIQSGVIEHNQKADWTKYKPVLGELSLLYEKMQQSIYNKISKENLKEAILTLTNYNCLDIKIWQKIVYFVTAHYKSSSLEDRLIFITSISEYLKKFYFSFNTQKRPPYKFMYPESYINDLLEFRTFLKAIENENDFLRQTDSEQQEKAKLLLLQNIIYLIMKATKKSDMNVYTVRLYFERRTDEMVLIASRYKKSELHKNLLYNIYFIYSYISMKEPSFFDKIEKYYYESFHEMMMTANTNTLDRNLSESVVAHKSKEMSKLLSIWKLNGRANHEIYEKSMKPLINFMLKFDLQKSYYSVICYNLVTAGIKDDLTINEIVEHYDYYSLKEDEFIHMLKHYLNAGKTELHYKSKYSKCKFIQNPKIIQYFHDRQVQVFSSCLQHQRQAENSKKRNFQYRKVQKLWTDIVKKLFQQKYNIIQNAVFCNYEIDFLILTKNFLLAIEIEGGHYNKKQFNKENSEIYEKTQSKQSIVTNGKKQMRQVILKAYGIQSVKIHCEQKGASYVMQSRDVQLGTQLLIQKISEQLGCSINDL